MGIFNFKEQRRTGKNFKRIKVNKAENTMEGRRMRTSPSLGFWPNSGSATEVPRSLLLQGDTAGMSMGRMRLLVCTQKSWDPPMKKKKVPRPNHRKTLHPMG